MDATHRAADTDRMDTRQKTIEELLTEARDITARVLGSPLPGPVVAEVFRQLCNRDEYGPADHGDSDARSVH